MGGLIFSVQKIWALVCYLNVNTEILNFISIAAFYGFGTWVSPWHNREIWGMGRTLKKLVRKYTCNEVMYRMNHGVGEYYTLTASSPSTQLQLW